MAFDHMSAAVNPKRNDPMTNFKHVNHSWDDAKATSLDPVERLVYRSNILGADQRITNTGGDNTSSKIMETDPLTGQETEIL
jgi:rhamnose utilization protein RhaD (predicted bifunctional aldolase and dehydrogenase)